MFIYFLFLDIYTYIYYIYNHVPPSNISPSKHPSAYSPANRSAGCFHLPWGRPLCWLWGDQDYLPGVIQRYCLENARTK